LSEEEQSLSSQSNQLELIARDVEEIDTDEEIKRDLVKNINLKNLCLEDKLQIIGRVYNNNTGQTERKAKSKA
jgi:hypothetical protein